MSPRSSASYGIRSFATLLMCRYRVSSESISSSTIGHHHISGGIRPSKFGYGGSMHQSMSISGGNSMKWPESKKEHENTLKVQPSDPAPPTPNIFSWVKWVFGSMLPLIFAFWKQKWDAMKKLEGKVEEVVIEAEEVAEVVEKIASTTEKLSAEVAEKLNNGELKDVALMVEHASSVIEKDAQMTEKFIHKVGDLKQDLKDLEAMVEPVINKIEQKK